MNNITDDFDCLPDPIHYFGDTLCGNWYGYFRMLTKDQFNKFAKTDIGGAGLFLANRWAIKYDLPVMHIGMYDSQADSE